MSVKVREKHLFVAIYFNTSILQLFNYYYMIHAIFYNIINIIYSEWISNISDFFVIITVVKNEN